MWICRAIVLLPRPRLIGGQVGAVVLFFVLVKSAGDPVMAMLVAAGWAIGVFLGVRFWVVVGLLRGDSQNQLSILPRSWGMGFWFSVFGAGSGLLLGGNGSPISGDCFLDVSVSLMLAINVVYSFAKAGCVKYGCCNLKFKYQKRWGVSGRMLPAFEACLSVGVFTGGFSLWWCGNKAICLAVCGIGHGILRTLSCFGEFKGETLVVSLCRSDTGGIALFCLAMTMLGVVNVR